MADRAGLEKLCDLRESKCRISSRRERAITKQLEREVAECEKLKSQVGNDDVRSLGSKPPSVQETRAYGRCLLRMVFDGTIHCFSVMLKWMICLCSNSRDHWLESTEVMSSLSVTWRVSSCPFLWPHYPFCSIFGMNKLTNINHHIVKVYCWVNPAMTQHHYGELFLFFLVFLRQNFSV